MTDALKPLPEAIESALAELMDAQFRLGMATRHLGPSAISRDTPQVLAASAAIVGVCNAVRAALAAPAVPHGWQLVPVEPTPAMRRAAVESREGRAVYKVTSKAGLEALEDIAADDYRAMLAAAPTPQEPTRAEGE